MNTQSLSLQSEISCQMQRRPLWDRQMSEYSLLFCGTHRTQYDLLLLPFFLPSGTSGHNRCTALMKDLTTNWLKWLRASVTSRTYFLSGLVGFDAVEIARFKSTIGTTFLAYYNVNSLSDVDFKV
jgi:hypothetical protein